MPAPPRRGASRPGSEDGTRSGGWTPREPGSGEFGASHRLCTPSLALLPCVCKTSPRETCGSSTSQHVEFDRSQQCLQHAQTRTSGKLDRGHIIPLYL